MRSARRLQGSNQSPVAPTIAPSALSFNPVSVGNSSQPQNLTVTNNSASLPLAISSVVVNGSFTETDDCTIQAIPPFARCTISVTSSPTNAGPQPGTLALVDNAPSNPLKPQSLQLMGYGIGPPTPTPSPAPTPIFSIY